MSYYDYIKGMDIEMGDYPFYAIIQAAMRRADSDNLKMLKTSFPDTWVELVARHKALGGLLEGESLD